MVYYRICEICEDVRVTHDRKQSGLKRCSKHQGQEQSIKVQVDNYFERKRIEGFSKCLG